MEDAELEVLEIEILLTLGNSLLLRVADGSDFLVGEQVQDLGPGLIRDAWIDVHGSSMWCNRCTDRWNRDLVGPDLNGHSKSMRVITPSRPTSQPRRELA